MFFEDFAFQLVFQGVLNLPGLKLESIVSGHPYCKSMRRFLNEFDVLVILDWVDRIVLFFCPFLFCFHSYTLLFNHSFLFFFHCPLFSFFAPSLHFTFLCSLSLPFLPLCILLFSVIFVSTLHFLPIPSFPIYFFTVSFLLSLSHFFLLSPSRLFFSLKFLLFFFCLFFSLVILLAFSSLLYSSFMFFKILPSNVFCRVSSTDPV